MCVYIYVYITFICIYLISIYVIYVYMSESVTLLCFFTLKQYFLNPQKHLLINFKQSNYNQSLTCREK